MGSEGFVAHELFVRSINPLTQLSVEATKFVAYQQTTKHCVHARDRLSLVTPHTLSYNVYSNVSYDVTFAEFQ